MLNNFNLFGAEHIISIIIPIIIGFAWIYWYRKTTTEKSRFVCRLALAFLIISIRSVRYIMDVYFGVFEWTDLFSLQICHIDLILLIICLIKPNKFLFNFCFMVGIPIALAVALFPGVNHPAPGLTRAMLFIMSHTMLVIGAVFLAITQKYKPSIKLYLSFAVFGNIALVAIYFINLNFKTNYLYIMSAPTGTVIESFSNIFGWPGYVFFMDALALILTLAMYFIGQILSKREENAKVNSVLEETNWYKSDISDVTKFYKTDTEKGLSSEEAKKRLEQYGQNELIQKEGPGIIRMFLEQFKDYMVIILIIASIVSLMVGEVTDSIVIIGIVILNSCLGVFQEYRAGKALEALKKISAPTAKVIRDGITITIPATELVPGDIAVIETGDYIPGDMRLFNLFNLKIEEASLTGESVPVEKIDSVINEDNIGLGDQINCGFMSTLVTYGHGMGIVTKTGMDTYIGHIAEMIQESTNEVTPLQKKLTKVGKLLGTGCLIICAIVFALGLIRGEPILNMFMTAISLAVAAIPEGLPAVVTIVLALGMQRMAKHNSIMKKLHAVETLGSTTVICSDKTGTLTQNQMTIEKMYVFGTELDVTGDGYNPEGKILIKNKDLNLSKEPVIEKLFEIQALCNDAHLKHNELDNEWYIMGDPTEGAMIVATEKVGINHKNLNLKYPRLQEIPFDSQRKLMTTFHKWQNNQFSALTKGAPDILIEKCTHVLHRDGSVKKISEIERKTILDENRILAGKAYRVLAMAYKEISEIPNHPTSEEIENNLIFCGLVGMIDPPRAESIEAIQVCKKAGIDVIMITGDFTDTAAAIAEQLKLITSKNQVVSGSELNDLSDMELNDLVKKINVFARVSPEHKVRIVQAIKDIGGIVAMTGDGINDAPALKRADIGIAMGITGTDVTKESADMILADDNFSSIVKAVEEGRVIFSNIRKFIFFLMSCNIGEILIIFIAMLINWPIPLLPIHLLWVNLLTDAFPALALGNEKKEPGLMSEKPRNPDEPIINRDMIVNIIVQSSVMTVAVLISFWFGWQQHGVEMGRTYALTTLILCELFRVYTCRSEKNSILKLGPLSNKSLNLATLFSLALLAIILIVPGFREIFNVSIIDIYDLDFIVLISLLPLLMGELTKYIKRTISKRSYSLSQ